MNKIPTAEEFLKVEQELFDDIVDGKVAYSIAYNCITNAMLEFTKLHVQSALKAANSAIQNEYGAELSRCYKQAEQDILNAYPENLIL
jgi:hypothetical protein